MATQQSSEFNFKEKAAELHVNSDEVQRFNETHSLALIMGPHRNQMDAEGSLSSVATGNLVHFESTGFDASLMDQPVVQLSERSDGEELPSHRRKSFGQKVLNNLAYNGLAFYHLRQDNPSAYDEYKARTLEDLDLSDGFFGLDFFSGHRAHLLFGILDKDSIPVPNDANNVQLPNELANRLRFHRIDAKQGDTAEQILLDPGAVFRTVTDYSIARQGMYHFRDHALATNVVRYEEAAYRSALGIKNEDVLPTQIVRGSGHTTSLASVLDDIDIKYDILRDEKSGDIAVQSEFGLTFDALKARNKEAAETLTSLLDVSGRDELTDILGGDTQIVDKVIANASQSEQGFVDAARLVSLIESTKSANIFKKMKMKKDIRSSVDELLG